MKSFTNLVKNELIKMFAQTAYRVMLIIMVVLLILVPLIFKGLSALIDGLGGFFDIEDDIKGYKEIIEETDDKLEKDYYEINLKALEFFANNDLDYDSWQYATMFGDYLYFYLSEHIFTCLRDGTVTWEDAENSSFSECLNDDMLDGDYGSICYELSNERKEYESLIEESTISDYYEKIYDDLLEAKKQYDTYLGHMKANQLFNDEYKYEIICLEKALLSYDNSLAILKHIKDNNVDYKSWEYNSWVATQTIVTVMLSYDMPISEQEFSTSSAYREEYDSYEEYLNKWQAPLIDNNEATLALEYSVLNNIPTQSAQSSSSKTIYNSTLMSNIELIMYFAIVLAGLIVANEFSSGSARLLFIRPHSRNKILLSKYVSILVVVIALNIVNVLISFGFTALFNGIGDIFAPNLFVKNGVVKEASAFLVSLGTIVLTNLRLIITVSFAFLISTLCKRGAIGIISGIALDFIISSIYSFGALASDLSFLKFTPIPFYMMEVFVNSKIEYVISQSYMSNLVLLGNATQYQIASQLNVWTGLAHFAFWFVACLVAIFVPFKKQEIKN